MTEVELLYGGTFSIDENDIKLSYYDTKYDGIVLVTHKGNIVTIKDSENNRTKWKPVIDNNNLN